MDNFMGTCKYINVLVKLGILQVLIRPFQEDRNRVASELFNLLGLKMF